MTNSLKKKQRFFIALLPCQKVQDYANEIKQHFANVYKSKAALKSPPHVTLQPPFLWEMTNLTNLEEVLSDFAQKQAKIPMIIDGFSAFPPRVIYLNVHKTPELLNIQKNLMNYLEASLSIVDKKSKSRSFSPHLTVGFRDLTKANFHKAWKEFKDQKVYFSSNVSQLTLLIHNGQKWEIKSEFPFNTARLSPKTN